MEFDEQLLLKISLNVIILNKFYKSQDKQIKKFGI